MSRISFIRNIRDQVFEQFDNENNNVIRKHRAIISVVYIAQIHSKKTQTNYQHYVIFLGDVKS